ncbi:MAG: cytochrome c biogenesis protein CcsA [Candidatus Omnitrophota bacterium]|nr:cytochrome c biogenesis protein CcsA [Candidatus Omnitrophota bacterium]
MKIKSPAPALKSIVTVALIAGCFAALIMPTLRKAPMSQSIGMLSEIPVQHAGRIKPFESFAREAVLYVTGKHVYDGQSPTSLVWQWMADPEKWFRRAMIPVTHKGLREEFSLMMVRNRITPEILLSHQPFLDQVQESFNRQELKEELSEVEKKRVALYEKAAFFRGIGHGALPGWIAQPDDPRKGWFPLTAFAVEQGRGDLASHYSGQLLTEYQITVRDILDSFKENSGQGPPLELTVRLREVLRSLFSSASVMLDEKVNSTEILYNRFQPFHWAWKLYLVSVLIAWTLLLIGGEPGKLQRAISALGFLCFIAGFVAHAYGFYLRVVISGRPPVTNMYESMIWVSWGVVLFSVILFAVYRAPYIRLTAAIVAALALVLAEKFPVALNPAMSPLVPVLRSNLWLTVHVLTITLSYGAFMLAWGLGHGIVYQYAFGPDNAQTRQRLFQYLYRSLQIGVILLACGTVLGGVWANYSWGRFWGWDPKETWALIALLGYLAVLHGRMAGWLSSFGVAVGSVVAFLGILMAWYGVNFVLGAGLHSYGFGGGGLTYVLSGVAVDLALLGWMVYAFRRRSAN